MGRGFKVTISSCSRRNSRLQRSALETCRVAVKDLRLIYYLQCSLFDRMIEGTSKVKSCVNGVLEGMLEHVLERLWLRP
jgi:hypothetical protein